MKKKQMKIRKFLFDLFKEITHIFREFCCNHEKMCKSMKVEIDSLSSQIYLLKAENDVIFFFFHIY